MLAVSKASNPLVYKEQRNWERVLTLACSFVKKDKKDRYKEEWNVALDKRKQIEIICMEDCWQLQIELNI